MYRCVLTVSSQAVRQQQQQQSILRNHHGRRSLSTFLANRHSKQFSTQHHSNEQQQHDQQQQSQTQHSHARNFQNSHPDGAFAKVAFIGTGKMAHALMQPMIRTGLQPAEKFMVYDVSPAAMQLVNEKLGVKTSDSIPEAIQDADLVICAVKPQNLTPGFYEELRKGEPLSGSILLSIVAGKAIEEFQKYSGFEKIVRSMPNTPAQVGEGMTVWSCTPSLTAGDRKRIHEVLQSCGQSMYVDDEPYIDMATSISGSGPAYIFLLMESMIDGAVHMGFPREKATTLVYHTMLGSTLYAMQTGEHPAILRNTVTSPSGTTASALYELENGRFRTVIKDAMWACYRRSLEMGHHNSNVGPGRHAVYLKNHEADDSTEEYR